MNIGMILAGGVGKRMGITSTPKQFLLLGSKPIIIHTVEKFLVNENIDEILVLVPKDWVNYTEALFEDTLTINYQEKISIIAGGSERYETIQKGLIYLKTKYGKTAENFIIVTHDAVRPFVTKRIIDDNIKSIQHNRCVDTIIPAADTIVELDENLTRIEAVPNRNYLFLGQTPQTFILKDYLKIYDNLSKEELKNINDVCKMYVEKNIEVAYVQGEESNFKITTNHDYLIAKFMIEVDNND